VTLQAVRRIPTGCRRNDQRILSLRDYWANAAGGTYLSGLVVARRDLPSWLSQLLTSPIRDHIRYDGYAAKKRDENAGPAIRTSNAGRPKGARNRATLVAEALLDGEAEALPRKAIELALAGDPIALRLCLDRILSPLRERPTTFALPELRSAADAGSAMAAILAAVASGITCVAEASELAKLVDAFVRASEATEKFEREQELNTLVPMRRS
jgi:hypothetical protein